MRRAEASDHTNAITPAAALESLKRALNFDDWPLREGNLVAGFSPSTSRLALLEQYQLDHEMLLPVISTWVGRRYFYRQYESRSAFALTVIVGHQSAKDVAGALLLQIVYSQMWSEPRVEFDAQVGDVAVYKDADSDESIAFVRNNIGISLENYSANGKGFSLEGLALEIDNSLKETPTMQSLSDHPGAPRILRFEPQARTIHPGEKTDLNIEVIDEHPPLHLLFDAKMGSYNQDPTKNDLWYFRAGPKSGQAEVALTVVNDINLMTQGRCSITIE